MYGRYVKELMRLKLPLPPSRTLKRYISNPTEI